MYTQAQRRLWHKEAGGELFANDPDAAGLVITTWTAPITATANASHAPYVAHVVTEMPYGARAHRPRNTATMTIRVGRSEMLTTPISLTLAAAARARAYSCTSGNGRCGPTSRPAIR